MNHRELIAAALRDAVASTDGAAASSPNGDQDEHALAQRIHRFRKAIRRARALLELVWEALPRDVRRETRDALRTSRRALGDARDYTVVPHILAEHDLPDVLRASANQILAEVRPPPTSQIEQLLQDGAALVRGEVDRVIAALPENVAWSVMRHGIERVYGRARRARKRARRDPHQFHVWRRRSKELSYQLDVLASAFGERVAAIAHDLDPVLDAQAIGVDLIMLCQVLRAHALSVPGIVADPLLDELQRRIDSQIPIARRAGKAAFRTKATDYARAVRHAGNVEPARDTAASDA